MFTSSRVRGIAIAVTAIELVNTDFKLTFKRISNISKQSLMELWSLADTLYEGYSKISNSSKGGTEVRNYIHFLSCRGLNELAKGGDTTGFDELRNGNFTLLE